MRSHDIVFVNNHAVNDADVVFSTGASQMASPSPTESAKRAPYRVLSAYCPDSQCGTKLYFPAWDSSIECSNCGKRYEQKALQNVEQVRLASL